MVRALIGVIGRDRLVVQSRDSIQGLAPLRVEHDSLRTEGNGRWRFFPGLGFLPK